MTVELRLHFVYKLDLENSNRAVRTPTERKRIIGYLESPKDSIFFLSENKTITVFVAVIL